VEPVITVHQDEVHLLAGRLSALATELHEGARSCRAVAARLSGALTGEEAWRAGAVATAWAALAGVLATRAAALAVTLVRASAAYRTADAGLAGSMTGAPR
jgi:hypothetical protein